jgi:hypothetical protein
MEMPGDHETNKMLLKNVKGRRQFGDVGVVQSIILNIFIQLSMFEI